MPIAPVVHAQSAAPLAALLPDRRGRAWQVGPAPYCIRPNAATSSITNLGRSLIVAEEGGRIEVFHNRPDKFATAPAAVADASDRDAVPQLAARILHGVLPALERESARDTARERGWRGVVADKADDMTEVGYALIAHGAHPMAVADLNGPALIWVSDSGAQWRLGMWGTAGNLTLTYDGPVSGLYAVLPSLLLLDDGQGQEDAGSAFTRHLAGRFPQLRPLTPGEVEFSRLGDVGGYIALPAADEPTDYADDVRRVVAEFSGLGADLLLTLVPHLI
ncbi:hypothetical protein [Streptomyces similanensis]|uniref:DUF1851 domain-containing protein n=1 Tax=Streptomyces similanensis TaxID=1274988 RepID=A0ABP9L7N2_9ACTN